MSCQKFKAEYLNAYKAVGGLTRYSEEEHRLGGESQQQEVGHEEGGCLRRCCSQDAYHAGGVVHKQLHLVEEAACQEGGKEDCQHLQAHALCLPSLLYGDYTAFVRCLHILQGQPDKAILFACL